MQGRPSIHITVSHRNVHLSEEGADVAVRVGELADSRLVPVRVGLATPVLVASAAYLQRRAAPISPAALSSHHIILLFGTTQPHAVAGQLLYHRGFRPRPAPEIDYWSPFQSHKN